MIYDRVSNLGAYAALHPAIAELARHFEQWRNTGFPDELTRATCAETEIALIPKTQKGLRYTADGRQTLLYIALSDGEDIRFAPSQSMTGNVTHEDGCAFSDDCANWTTIHMKEGHFLLLYPWDACQRAWRAEDSERTRARTLCARLTDEAGD